MVRRKVKKKGGGTTGRVDGGALIVVGAKAKNARILSDATHVYTTAKRHVSLSFERKKEGRLENYTSTKATYDERRRLRRPRPSWSIHTRG